MGIIGWLIFGGLVGWIASKIMGTDALRGIGFVVVAFALDYFALQKLGGSFFHRTG